MVEVTIELDRIHGTDLYDYRILAKRRIGNIFVSDVVCHGYSFVDRETALADARKWVASNHAEVNKNDDQGIA